MSAKGTTHTATGPSDSQLVPGALATSRQGVGQALNSTGFINVVGHLRANFKTYLDRQPFAIEVGDLKPGMLVDLADWVVGKIAEDPDQAQEAQAYVRPERAVKLLT